MGGCCSKIFFCCQPPKDPPSDPAPPQLNTEVLNASLHFMADYISRSRQNITVISVGGAVDVMFLRTRTSTDEVIFFNQSLNKKQRKLLHQATLFAGLQMRSKWRIELLPTWFTSASFPLELRKQLTNEAFEQNDVVFQAAGLEVLAAPWQYAFSAEVDKIARGGGSGGSQGYDNGNNAAHYLCYYLTKRNETYVPIRTVRHWGGRYKTKTGDGELRVADDAYTRLYGVRPIHQ
ncbi:hypothetical protein MMC20_000785 [Loxospora ochrophaea]|nr:hypothetical protein [Loxospora ochrophaea]